MSELKITISQLEDLLDRQKSICIDAIFLKSKPIEPARSNEQLFNRKTIEDAINRADYPHDFNILKRYVK